MPEKKGLLLVVSGPSGVGKGTVCSRLREKNPALQVSVSVTERAAREGEQNGEHYYFLTSEQFTALAENGGLLEWARYGTNRYGTPREPVMKALEAGRDMILEIEVEGAMQVKAGYPECVLIFVAPPDMTELENRLRNRQTEDEGQIQSRLVIARREMERMAEYDYVIENHTVEGAVESLERIIREIKGQD